MFDTKKQEGYVIRLASEFNFNDVLANGITVCHDHHLICEKYHITNGNEWICGFHPNDLYKKIGSSLEIAIEIDKKN